MKIPKYPDDFFSFGGGAEILNLEINEWIQEGINELELKEDGRYFSKATGNSLVIARKFEDQYDVIVAKNYSSAYIER